MDNVITVKGTPYEQGVLQGRLLCEVIIHNIKEVKAKLLRDHVDMERYQLFTERNAGFMKENHEDIFEEMKGIAEGAGVSFEDILLLNIPAYFMTQYFNQECSMIMARGKATADGCTYVIKNRDMGTYIEQAVIQREYPNGVKMVEVNGAGTVTYPASGMNSFGLGIATTGFWSHKVEPEVETIDSTHIFVNIHLLLKNCRTAREAVEYVKNSPRMNGLNLILVDAKEAFVVEMTKDDIYVEKDDGTGLLFRTNHYCSEKFCSLNPEEKVYPSTFRRRERIEELLKEQYGRIRFQDLFRIMSDHKNGVNAICRHPQPGYPAWTMSTSMFVLEDMEAWTTIDNPCKNLRYSSLKGEA